MDRRNFLQRASAGALAFAFPRPAEFRAAASLFRDTRMGIVVHSYASRWNGKTASTKFPPLTNALDLLEHCQQVGAGGVQTVIRDWSADFVKQVRDRREKLGLYLEGSVALPKTAADLPKFEQDVRAAREAGAQILRTVSLGGRRYETFRALADWEAFRKTGIAALQLAEPVLRKHQVKLGVENHKDWRADELAGILKNLSSEWVGATIDFGNSMALLEDPMEVVKTLAPYVVSTHAKDMAVEEYPNGFLLSEVPLGQGLLDLPAIIAVCKKHNPNVTFNLEMITRDPLEIPCLKEEYWATFPNVSGGDLARMMRVVRQSKKTPLPRVSPLSAEEKLALENRNIVACVNYSKEQLAMR